MIIPLSAQVEVLEQDLGVANNRIADLEEMRRSLHSTVGGLNAKANAQTNRISKLEKDTGDLVILQAYRDKYPPDFIEKLQHERDVARMENVRLRENAFQPRRKLAGMTKPPEDPSRINELEAALRQSIKAQRGQLRDAIDAVEGL